MVHGIPSTDRSWPGALAEAEPSLAGVSTGTTPPPDGPLTHTPSNLDGTVPDGQGLASAWLANASCPMAAATAKPPIRTACFTFAMQTPYGTAPPRVCGTRQCERL